MSNQALLDKLDRTTETLAQTLSQLVRLSSIDDPGSADSSEGNATEISSSSTASLATTSILMVHSQTMQLIKGIQDLLIITRSIRETWVLGQVPDKDKQRETKMDYEKCEAMLDRALNEIFGPPRA
ncbi:Srb6p Ecym_4402 [Eremothecium cymbalariae DBVPG|uniref:Mediator of RNA polymerase II transcription subunit 22 n=1 Tax=Eremothecium cymbalariae (strain CBS 270.75 / DBVPG 7215 / KCTC 17166 / NRRL Y-17582) TaxID=931890 RepID=G8JTV3_ERECY|nr:hypothetical protein Ecym_4402 [Eremothecium cymbalariae DBVPG\